MAAAWSAPVEAQTRAPLLAGASASAFDGPPGVAYWPSEPDVPIAARRPGCRGSGASRAPRSGAAPMAPAVPPRTGPL